MRPLVGRPTQQQGVHMYFRTLLVVQWPRIVPINLGLTQLSPGPALTLLFSRHTHTLDDKITRGDGKHTPGTYSLPPPCLVDRDQSLCERLWSKKPTRTTDLNDLDCR